MPRGGLRLPVLQELIFPQGFKGFHGTITDQELQEDFTAESQNGWISHMITCVQQPHTVYS